MMMALDVSAPPISRNAVDVVLVNSSMFCRVPGPADFDDTVDTISAYGNDGVARRIAWTIGVVA